MRALCVEGLRLHFSKGFLPDFLNFRGSCQILVRFDNIVGEKAATRLPILRFNDLR